MICAEIGELTKKKLWFTGAFPAGIETHFLGTASGGNFTGHLHLWGGAGAFGPRFLLMRLKILPANRG